MEILSNLLKKYIDMKHSCKIYFGYIIDIVKYHIVKNNKRYYFNKNK